MACQPDVSKHLFKTLTTFGFRSHVSCHETIYLSFQRSIDLVQNYITSVEDGLRRRNRVHEEAEKNNHWHHRAIKRIKKYARETNNLGQFLNAKSKLQNMLSCVNTKLLNHLKNVKQFENELLKLQNGDLSEIQYIA